MAVGAMVLSMHGCTERTGFGPEQTFQLSAVIMAFGIG